jgi:hypothetical protein
MVKQIDLDLGEIDIKKVSVFARHETFHPRFGWLKKGFDRAVQDPEIFGRDDAPVRLGVGKNMVRSIRYWCAAFKVLNDRDGVSPTDLGTNLLGEGGWDPYLEDTASLWLLHFRQTEFSVEDLVLALSDYANMQGFRVAESSLRKDVTCILRMYVEQEGRNSLNEDLVDCPFTVLRLLYPLGDSKRYEFQVGPKDSLPADVIVYACLDFANRVAKNQRTMSLSRLAFDPGSPGMVFKLSESAIAEAIENIAGQYEDMTLSDTEGLLQFSYDHDPGEFAYIVLADYYSEQSDMVESRAGYSSKKRAS